MAKPNRGGKRGAGVGGGGGGASVGGGIGGAGGGSANAAINNINSNAQAANVQVDNSAPAQAMSAPYQSFMAMTNDQKADYIDSVASKPVPVFLADNAFQSFIYNSQMNDKPQVVSESTLNSMKGTELFRTVNNVYNQRADISYRADEIAAQISKGSVTRVSDTGGSVYGRGIYFANTYSGSIVYGNTRGNVQKTAVLRCKLNSNARSISYNAADKALSSEIGSGSKLGKSLGKIASRDRKSAVSIYALSQGFNVITNGSGYFNVLNRNAVTVSDTVKAMGSSW